MILRELGHPVSPAVRRDNSYGGTFHVTGRSPRKYANPSTFIGWKREGEGSGGRAGGGEDSEQEKKFFFSFFPSLSLYKSQRDLIEILTSKFISWCIYKTTTKKNQD